MPTESLLLSSGPTCTSPPSTCCPSVFHMDSWENCASSRSLNHSTTRVGGVNSTARRAGEDLTKYACPQLLMGIVRSMMNRINPHQRARLIMTSVPIVAYWSLPVGGAQG